MNSENFHEYLKNPSMLHQVSYQELKSLMLQYPYATNLRYLMVLKSLFDHHKDYDRNLTLASLGSIDRKKLWHLVRQYSHEAQTQDHLSIGEDFLELRDLSTLEEAGSASPEETTTPRTRQVEVDQLKDMSDQELHQYFRKEEGLEFLDDLFGEPLEDKPDAGTDESEGELSMLEDILEEDQPGTSPKPPEQPEEIEEEIGDLFEGLSEAAPIKSEVENTTQEAEDTIEEVLGSIEVKEEDMAAPDKPGAPEDTEEPPEEPADASSGREDGSGTLEAPAPEAGGIEDLEEETPDGEEEGPGEEDPAGQPEEEPAPKVESSGQTGPTPKKAFGNWKHKLHKPGILSGELPLVNLPTQEEEEEEEEEEEVYEEPDDQAKEVASKSLLEDTEIASETLAAVLERQGHFEKAIKMYEKLSLQYPEKSSFFAAKIEKLQKK